MKLEKKVQDCACHPKMAPCDQRHQEQVRIPGKVGIKDNNNQQKAN